MQPACIQVLLTEDKASASRDNFLKIHSRHYVVEHHRLDANRCQGCLPIVGRYTLKGMYPQDRPLGIIVRGPPELIQNALS